jgi:hypothetical protein
MNNNEIEIVDKFLSTIILSLGTILVLSVCFLAYISSF